CLQVEAGMGAEMWAALDQSYAGLRDAPFVRPVLRPPATPPGPVGGTAQLPVDTMPRHTGPG
ncbi:unnamed protein product, partial [Coregonus sp. 'balchen']